MAFIAAHSSAQSVPSAIKVGQIEMTNIFESSGLAASKRYPGVLWTHNDTGFPAFLFAMSTNGARIGAFELQGMRLLDWEATAADSLGHLYLADIGTNVMARSHSAIHRVLEPNPYNRWGPVRPLKTWLIRFPLPERPDCESFFVHGGYGYVITKYLVNGRVDMYRFPLASEEDSVLVEYVTSIPLNSSLSDASLSDDSSRLALVTERGVYVLFIGGDPTSAGTAEREFLRSANNDMEGVTWVGNAVLTTAEGSLDILSFQSPLFSGAPFFDEELEDQFAFVGGSVTFRAALRGFPAPTFTWLFNGVVLPGRTSPRLTLGNLSLADSGVYTLIASNINGVATSSATLTVTEKTNQLQITEVMSSPLLGAAPVADWWELTSFDTNVIDLSGWRFNDSTGDLTDAFVIPTGVTIRPNESIIFVENLSPTQFRQWWGESNIPASTQIITYIGPALSFRVTGDMVRLWSSTATDPNDLMARVEFGQAEPGRSFYYDAETETFGLISQVGVDGAFKAATGEDVASPGRVGDAPTGAAPAFTTQLTDQFATVGGSLVLSAAATGTPAPSFQWTFNGQVIPGATNAQLSLTNLSLTNSGIYELSASNPNGTAMTSARVTVIENTVDVRITEVMSSRAAGTSPTADWWELTSFDTETIDLSGWRFNDSTGDLNDAFVIPNGVTIAPNESIVFVENLTADEFRTWWGAENLAGVQIITYTGAALSFSVAGDRLRLWAADATDTNDVAAEVSFGAADGGVSFGYDLATQQFGVKSQVGVNGAFQAATGADVGSPGRVGGGQPRFLTPVANQTVETGSDVILSAVVVGSPPPSFQWRFNGQDIPGATSSSLLLQSVTAAQAGTYELVASNALGVATSSAVLTVTENVPQVRITEVLSSQAPATVDTEDWWELTSFDTDAIDLSGWRFNDSAGGLADAFVIPAGVTISPGESIIFVENLTADEFRLWWGSTNVPVGAQIITYQGAALSFRVTGDSVILWDDEATQDSDFVTRADFGAADVGISFIYDPTTGQFGKKSQLGVDGAVQAAEAPDVGSPGRFGSNAALQLGAQLNGRAIVIRFNAESGKTYTLEASNGLGSDAWTQTDQTYAATEAGAKEFTQPEDRAVRFYRVRVE